MSCSFSLSYKGNLADQNMIQFYDVAHALWGFERTIAITTHLLLNGKVITQSPSAKGFQLLVPVPEAGSWKWNVTVAIGSAIGALGLAPPDSQFGWLAKSAVSYVISETLGFEPNFDETLGKQIEQYREQNPPIRLPDDLSNSRFDSVIEKCESGLRAMHRPIAFSGTAERADVSWSVGPKNGQFDSYLDDKTYNYIAKTVTAEDIEEFVGYVSSYNSNTYNGRIFIPQENRNLPFTLAPESITLDAIRLLTSSLRTNAIARRNSAFFGDGDVKLRAFRNETVNGRTKSLYVIDVEEAPLDLLV